MHVGVKNFSFSEHFAFALNQWSHSGYPENCDDSESNDIGIAHFSYISGNVNRNWLNKKYAFVVSFSFAIIVLLR